MRKMMLSLALVPAVLAGLSGCASVNPCNGKHGGVCTGPREVYGVTNHRDQVHPTKKEVAAQNKIVQLLATKPSPQDRLPSISAANIISLKSSGASHPMTREYAPTSGPTPLLSQPRILRVWIAPWSRQGSLHFPGYVYTIVTPEQWVFAPSTGETPVPAPE